MFRGEIWEFSPAKAKRTRAAQARRVVLISSDSLGVLPLRIVVPLVPWQEPFTNVPWMVRIPPTLHSGLDQTHAADALQVRAVMIPHLIRRVGELPRRLVDAIEAAVNSVIAGG